MIHPLFVGHFDTSVRLFKPKVTKALDLSAVKRILTEYCDRRPDGSLFLNEQIEEDLLADWAAHGVSLGRIGNDSVVFKDGYLICPWLGATWNRTSVKFVCELQDSLGMQIFEPGDGKYFTRQTLFEEEREHDRYVERYRSQSDQSE